MATKPHHAAAYRRLCRILREWREEAGLRQRGLAAALRKPHSFVYKVETGQRRIDPVEFAAWCRACGIDPADGIRTVTP